MYHPLHYDLNRQRGWFTMPGRSLTSTSRGMHLEHVATPHSDEVGGVVVEGEGGGQVHLARGPVHGHDHLLEHLRPLQEGHQEGGVPAAHAQSCASVTGTAGLQGGPATWTPGCSAI